MAVTFADNIKYSGNKPDFVRQEYETFADMRAVKDAKMPELYIAYCLEDRNYYKYDKELEVDPVLGKFRLWASGSGGGSGLEETISVNTPVGNIKDGDIYSSGSSITTLLKNMLQAPVYFKADLNLSVDAIQKIGDSINGVTLTAVITREDTDIKTIKYYAGSNLIAEKDSVTDPNIGAGGEFAYEYRLAVTDFITFKIEVEDIKGHIETISKSISFVNPYYYGVSSSNPISGFTGFTEDLINKVSTKVIKYTSNDSYLVIAYDASYGNLTSIKDQNNFENISAWTYSNLTVNNELYKVYISNTKITCTNFEYTFKW